MLVAVETAILFGGVVSRYVFHRPFTWSDELASILFLWLAMLGAVVAYRRVEHMRMSALVNNAGPRRRALADALALAAGLAFLALILHPALEYAHRRGDDRDAGPRGAEHLARHGAAGRHRADAAARRSCASAARCSLPTLALALAVVVAVGAGLWLLKPALAAIGNYRLVVFFVLLVGAAVLTGIPIAFAFGLGTFAHLALTTRTPLTVVVSRMDEGMSHIILLSVPLFVFLGLLIEITGMARTMVGFPREPASVTCAAGCITCCSARCISSPASRARRPPTWRRSRRCCSPR